MSSNQTTIPAGQNVAIDVVKQMGQKQPPTNAQISELLQKTQTFIDEKQNDSTIPFETLKAMTDFKGVLEATEQLNRNKNEDESLQKIVMESASATKDLTSKGKQMKDDPSLQSKGQQFSATTKQLSQSVWELLKLMGTNGQFRSQINSLVSLLQEMFLSQGQQSTQQIGQQPTQSIGQQPTQQISVDTNSNIKPSEAAATTSLMSSSTFEQEIIDLKNQQISEAEPSSSSGKRWRVNPPSQEKKHEMASHLLSILRALNEKPEFKTGLNDLIDIFQDLRAGDAPHSEMKGELASNPHVDASYTESKKLIEKFSGRPIDPFVANTKVFFAFVRKDERSRAWFDDFVQLLRDSAQNPHNVDEAQFTARVEKLITDASNLTKEKEFRDKYADVTVELKALANGIKEDEDVKNLQIQTQKFLSNFTYLDENGKKRFNTDLVSQLRTFIVPLLISQLDSIPLPPVQGSNEEMDYYFDNMILDGKQIIPDQVDIHTQSDVSMKIHNLSASHSKSSAFITINNIKPQVSNVHFRFARKTFPKLSDEGVANVLVQGNDGITIHISLDLMKQGTENMFQFQLGDVTVDIDQLNIEIVSAKHDFLLKVFSSVYQTRVKRLLEQKISEKIQEVFGRIQDGMNNIMAHYGSPSKLKEVITNKVGNLKSSSKTDVQTPSTTTTTPTAIQS